MLTRLFVLKQKLRISKVVTYSMIGYLSSTVLPSEKFYQLFTLDIELQLLLALSG